MTTDEIAKLPTVKMFLGEDRNLGIRVRNKDRSPVDLTGSTVYFMAKREITDLDADAILDETVNTFDDPSTGVASIPIDLSALDADEFDGVKLICDFVIKDAADKVSNYGLMTLTLKRGVRIAIP
jgi:hypothetical protein